MVDEELQRKLKLLEELELKMRQRLRPTRFLFGLYGALFEVLFDSYNYVPLDYAPYHDDNDGDGIRVQRQTTAAANDGIRE